MNPARQGEVWFVDLDPTRGREQAGRRPAVVVSVDQLGTGASELAIVVPLTRTERPNPLYVPIEPPEGGVRDTSYAMPEMVRAVSRQRLVERWGTLRPATVEQVLQRVHLLLRPAR
ncbi:MAG: mRNA interferase MazF [Solirubrobacteraceae bacterium]|nr:mRNA interferase MazF [Solirubrobacteraceae bacterium]